VKAVAGVDDVTAQLVFAAPGVGNSSGVFRDARTSFSIEEPIVRLD